MDGEVTITVRPNGPYRIQGPITLIDADGNPLAVDSDMVFLCRCGGSSTKPFCDGTHKRAQWNAASGAGAYGVRPVEEPRS